MSAGVIRWTIETWDFPYGQLPTNTNDGKTREFPIVEEYGFRVEAFRAPPIAEVEVSLFVTPGLQAPTALIVVAPLLFNFSRNCLVSGAEVVIDCNPSTPMPNGQKTAKLDVVETGLVGRVPEIRIRVSTPAKAPLERAWFIEGRDEWSDEQYG